MKNIFRITTLGLVSLGYAGLFWLPKLPTAKFLGLLDLETVTMLATCLWLLWTAKSKELLWRGMAFALILVTFTLPLLRVWQNATSNDYIVLGIFPWSDASNYYWDANHLLNGGLFSPVSGSRPLFPAFMSALLALSGRNIQLVVVILMVMTASAVFIFATWASDRAHPLAGVVIVVFSWFYYGQVVGSTMTEQLGLPLGILALTALLKGVMAKNSIWYAGGLLGLTFALLARAGAFFVLPFLLAYGFFYFKRQEKSAIKISALLLCALILPISINAWLGKLVADPNSVPMGNFAYTFYGQATGGKGWQQIFLDHPEIFQMVGSQQTQAIFRVSLEIIQKNPGLFFQGITQAYQDYFGLSQFAAFGFLHYWSIKNVSVYQGLATFLMIIGFLTSLIKIRNPIYGLTVAGFAGILCSLPFIPPAESSWMRIQAATVIWEFWLIGLACALITTQVLPNTDNLAFESFTSRFVQVFSLGLICVALLGAAVHFLTPPPRAIRPKTCDPGKVAIQFPVFRQMFVIIQNDKPGKFPEIDFNTYSRSLANFPGVYWDFTKTINQIEPPATLLFTINMDGNGLWIIAPPTLGAAGGQIVSACVATIQTPHSVIKIESFEIQK